ncbi:MAG: DUF2752 domain-containing protein [Planctomycetes bacterium]|nr:DUF2752 domain-containing protein [Planctomycetota bacterium]
MSVAVPAAPPAPPTARGLGARTGLALAIVGLALAWLAEADAAGARWFGVTGPACPLDALLGPRACPGCGLTRATCLAAQGDWVRAIAAHPAGPVVTVALWALLLVSAHALRRGGMAEAHRRVVRVGSRLVAAALALAWGWRLAMS